MAEQKNYGKLCKHEHIFYLPKKQSEFRVLIVLIITFITLIIEIIAGYLFNSVALLADGIHMVSHTFAFLIAFFAYYFARKLSKDVSFTFGTWKIEVLGAYTNSLILLFLALLVLSEAIGKFFNPGETQYEEALIIATLGLFVNLISAYILYHKEESHGAEKYHSHTHDLNLRGALYHVITDALTSVLAIIALLAGKYFNLWYMDPLMGIIGFVVIVKWSLSLIKESLPILLDREAKNPLYEELIKALESDGKTIVNDIHLLRIHHNKYACIVGLTTQEENNLEYYEDILSNFEQIAHVNIELRKCPKE